MFHRKSVKSQSQASFVFSPLFPGSSCRSSWNEEEADREPGLERLLPSSSGSLSILPHPTPFPLCEVDDLVKTNLVKMTISTTALAASSAPAALTARMVISKAERHLWARAGSAARIDQPLGSSLLLSTTVF